MSSSFRVAPSPDIGEISIDVPSSGGKEYDHHHLKMLLDTWDALLSDSGLKRRLELVNKSTTLGETPM